MKTPIKSGLRAFALSLLLSAGTGRAEAATPPGPAFEAVTAEHEQRLAVAIERLRVLRESVHAEQVPLARALREKRTQAKALREELQHLKDLAATKVEAAAALTDQVRAARQEYAYLSRTLLNDYFATYDASLSPGERAGYGETLRRMNLAEQSGAADEEAMLAGSLAMLEESTERLRGVLGGKRYAGEALTSGGRVESGTYLQVGPLTYFVGAGGAPAVGWVEESAGGHAQVRVLPETAAREVVAFASGTATLLPVDTSLGGALQMEGTRDGLLTHLRKGGVWVYPILGFALVAGLVGAIKVVQIFRVRLPDPAIVHRIAASLREGRPEDAAAFAAGQPPPARDMLMAAVEHVGEPVELIEEVMYESLLGVQPRLERWLNLIAVTAATAPLLGLLGTVTGIIKTFDLMHVFGAGDPKPLITGISEALITTELGLVLAIPALVLHALLARKVSGIMARLEKLALALVNSLSRGRGRREEDAA